MMNPSNHSGLYDQTLVAFDPGLGSLGDQRSKSLQNLKHHQNGIISSLAYYHHFLKTSLKYVCKFSKQTDKRPPSHRLFGGDTKFSASEACTFTQPAMTHAQCKIMHKLCHDNINASFLHLEYEPENSCA